MINFPKILKYKYKKCRIYIYFKFTNKYQLKMDACYTYLSLCPLHPVVSRPLFIERHVADSRKSPIANPTGRETILLFLFLWFARTRDWVCALGMR